MALTVSPVRARMVALARSYVGCGIFSNRARYMDLVAGPGDTDQDIRRSLARTPGCSLVARGLLRAMGCTHPRLIERWQDGLEVEDLKVAAHDAGAWVGAATRGGRLPLPGDIGISRTFRGSLHCFAVLEREGDSLPCQFSSIEGGHVEHQICQLICHASRTWTEDCGEILDDNGRVRRTVDGWLDLARLFGVD